MDLWRLEGQARFSAWRCQHTRRRRRTPGKEVRIGWRSGQEEERLWSARGRKTPRRNRRRDALADGKWTLDRAVTQFDPLPPPPVPFERARVQRERITRTDIEAFGTTAGCPGCDAIRSGKRAQAHSDPCRARIEECLKTTPGVSERLDRRREVLNEAPAKKLRERQKKSGNRKYSRRVGSTTEYERHADPTRLRPETETCHEGSDRSCEQWQSQMEGSRAVAQTPTQQNSTTDESRMDVEEEERDESRKFDSTEHQMTNNDENIDGGEQK